MFKTYIIDTATGNILAPIDIPEFSWTLSIKQEQSGLVTRPTKINTEGSTGGINIRWDSIPGETPTEKQRWVKSYDRGIVLMWEDSATERTPIICGAIGDRTDKELDTSFNLIPYSDIVGSRVVTDFNAFGRDNHTTNYSIEYSNRSLRSIVCELGKFCTKGKHRELPIEWPYPLEPGAHSISVQGFNVNNITFKKIIEQLTKSTSAPDVKFKPYMKAFNQVAVQLLCAPDNNVSDSPVHTFTYSKYHGTFKNIKIARRGGVDRLYATGAGKDQSMLCYAVEKPQNGDNSHPIIERVLNNQNAKTFDDLKSFADSAFNMLHNPRLQIQGSYNILDGKTPLPGRIWPGDKVLLNVYNTMALESKVYLLTIMELKGSTSSEIDITFDAIDTEDQ